MKYKIKTALVGSIVTLLTLFTAQAVILHPAHGDLTREDIEQAFRDLGALFPEVGTVVGDKGGQLVLGGSCVAISDEIAVSAKHGSFIRTGPRTGEPYDAIHVVFGENSKDEVRAGRLHTTIAVHRHETLDLAVYEFAEGELADVPKALLFDGVFAPEIDDVLIHVGMGDYAHVGDSEAVWDGYRRACNATVSGPHGAFPENYIVTRFARTSAVDYLPDGGRGAQGDSGGGTFVELEDGSYALVAINELASLDIGYGFTGALPIGDSGVQAFLAPFLDDDEGPLPDDGDADEDGWSNLAEEAFGTDPEDASSQPTFIPRRVGNELLLNYLQLEGGELSRSGYVVGTIRYLGECATGQLANWLPAQTCEPATGLPDSPEGYVWGAFCMPMDTKSGFIRVRIVREEPGSP